ncbi:hypothetical protein B0H21DRAFT_729621 [Amylocystis lapponica]|nr:hypothetical protein B0H21DRAFT_729621 [Amylocystis lapponica]
MPMRHTSLSRFLFLVLGTSRNKTGHTANNQAHRLSKRDLTVDTVYFLQLAQEVGRGSAAALCLLAWDICITTGDEVSLRWMTPWTCPNLLYLIARYYSLIAVIVLNTHRMTRVESLIFEGVSALILEFTVEMMLILRLYAMSVGDRKLLYATVITFVLQAIIMTSFSVKVSLPAEMVVYTATSILYESFLFFLMFTRYMRSRRGSWTNSSLMTVLFRDGAFTFAVVFVAMMANTMLFTLGPRTLASLGFPYVYSLWTATCLLTNGPRLITGVRASSAQQRQPPSTMGDVQIGDLCFRMDESRRHSSQPLNEHSSWYGMSTPGMGEDQIVMASNERDTGEI